MKFAEKLAKFPLSMSPSSLQKQFVYDEKYGVFADYRLICRSDKINLRSALFDDRRFRPIVLYKKIDCCSDVGQYFS